MDPQVITTVLSSAILITLLILLSFQFVMDPCDSRDSRYKKFLASVFFWPFILVGVGFFYVVIKPLIYIFKFLRG